MLPEKFLERMKNQLGEEFPGFLESLERPRAVALRFNPLKGDSPQLPFVREEVPWEPMGYYYDPQSRPGLHPYHEAGVYYLQEASAMSAVALLQPQPGEWVCDLCAAPGGKTTQMAALSGNTALITACEKNKIRAERLQFNLDRQGAKRVSVMCQDARQLSDLFKFDKVLLDAPCTGAGTILIAEGEPERRMTPDWVAKTASTQKAMLKKALTLLSAGHEMVYSTCSILREENEDVLKAVLPGMNAEIVPIEHEFLQHAPLLPTTIPGVVCVKPNELFEGFFVAKIRKRK